MKRSRRRPWAYDSLPALWATPGTGDFGLSSLAFLSFPLSLFAFLLAAISSNAPLRLYRSLFTVIMHMSLFSFHFLHHRLFSPHLFPAILCLLSPTLPPVRSLRRRCEQVPYLTLRSLSSRTIAACAAAVERCLIGHNEAITYMHAHVYVQARFPCGRRDKCAGVRFTCVHACCGCMSRSKPCRNCLCWSGSLERLCGEGAREQVRLVIYIMNE